jgi:hypothetical protein
MDKVRHLNFAASFVTFIHGFFRGVFMLLSLDTPVHIQVLLMGTAEWFGSCFYFFAVI